MAVSITHAHSIIGLMTSSSSAAARKWCVVFKPRKEAQLQGGRVESHTQMMISIEVWLSGQYEMRVVSTFVMSIRVMNTKVISA